MWRKIENFEGGHLWKQRVSVYGVTVCRCQMCVAPANSSQYFKPTKVKLSPPPRLIFQMLQSHTDEKMAEPRATWQPLAAALPGSPTQIDYRSRWRSATVFSFQMSLMRHPPCCLFTNSSSLWRPHSFFFYIVFIGQHSWAPLCLQKWQRIPARIYFDSRGWFTPFFLNGT